MLKLQDCPTISVIIPCFNGRTRLDKCLKSIKMQNYPQEKIEYIVVDDDSTDGTPKLAKEKYGCKVLRNGTHNIERGKLCRDRKRTAGADRSDPNAPPPPGRSPPGPLPRRR